MKIGCLSSNVFAIHYIHNKITNNLEDSLIYLCVNQNKKISKNCTNRIIGISRHLRIQRRK